MLERKLGDSAKRHTTHAHADGFFEGKRALPIR
jgi:hypothetical protein